MSVSGSGEREAGELPSLVPPVSLGDFVVAWAKFRRGRRSDARYQKRDHYVRWLAYVCLDAPGREPDVEPQVLSSARAVQRTVWAGAAALQEGLTQRSNPVVLAPEDAVLCPFPTFLLCEVIMASASGPLAPGKPVVYLPDVRDWFEHPDRMAMKAEIEQAARRVAHLLDPAVWEESEEVISAAECLADVASSLAKAQALVRKLEKGLTRRNRTGQTGRKRSSEIKDNHAVEVFFWRQCGASYNDIAALLDFAHFESKDATKLRKLANIARERFLNPSLAKL